MFPQNIKLSQMRHYLLTQNVYIIYFNLSKIFKFWDDLEKGSECSSSFGPTLGLIGPRTCSRPVYRMGLLGPGSGILDKIL